MRRPFLQQARQGTKKAMRALVRRSRAIAVPTGGRKAGYSRADKQRQRWATAAPTSNDKGGRQPHRQATTKAGNNRADKQRWRRATATPTDNNRDRRQRRQTATKAGNSRADKQRRRRAIAAPTNSDGGRQRLHRQTATEADDSHRHTNQPLQTQTSGREQGRQPETKTGNDNDGDHGGRMAAWVSRGGKQRVDQWKGNRRGRLTAETPVFEDRSGPP